MNAISYPVMEITPTLQGEGFHQGEKAIFLRLAKCDVGCVWCDVKESWDETKYPLMSIEAIKQKLIQLEPYNIVVVTGGEPLIHDCKALTTMIKSLDKRTHVETSGTQNITGEWDWMTFSPKKFKKPLDEYFDKANELKIVIYHHSDLEWAEGLSKKVHKFCHYFLQPEWSKKQKTIPMVMEHIHQNPKWKMSVQLHKYLEIP